MSAALFMLVFAVGTLIGLAALVRVLKAQNIRLPNDDAAFTGKISFDSSQSDWLQEIKPLVDRVGVVSAGLHDRSGRYENNDVHERFDVFVIDVNGAIHDIEQVKSPERAIQLAMKAAKTFDVPIEDPGAIMNGR